LPECYRQVRKRRFASAAVPTTWGFAAFAFSGETGKAMATKEERGERALRVVRRLLDALESKIDADVKCSVADFIRLVQLERELMSEQVKEIHVSWQETKKEKPNNEA
jgi:hypothetical protein